MTIISLIAAIDESGGLGINNQLLCHLPADLQHFKSITMGKPIIMGRKTFHSIGKPLPGRLNIVLSRSLSFIDGVHVLDSLEKAIEYTAGHHEIMIIGGAELFNDAIDKASSLYITHIHHQFAADVFFQKSMNQFGVVERSNSDIKMKNKHDMTFCVYERNH